MIHPIQPMLSNYTWTTGSDNQGQIEIVDPGQEISDPGQIPDCLIWVSRTCPQVSNQETVTLSGCFKFQV